MPLWSTSRPTPSPSTSYPSRRNDQGPPVLPPIVPLTPSFGAGGGTPTFLTNSTLASSSKGKHVQGHDDQEEEDDPWKDGSDSENDQLDLVKQLKISTTSPPPPPITTSSSTTTISPTSTSGGGGWFSSLGFSSSSSSNPNSRSNSTSVPSTSASSSTNPQSQSQSKTLRRQPSAKDVALALQSSNSPSTTTTTSNQSQSSSSSRLGPGTIKRGGSYIAGVNQIQEEAVRVVLEEEEEKEKRKSLEQGGDHEVNRRRSRESGRGERDSEDSEIGRKRVESSERERLKKSIREDVNELVRGKLYPFRSLSLSLSSLSRDTDYSDESFRSHLCLTSITTTMALSKSSNHSTTIR